MEDKDKVGAYISLYKQQMERFSHTRDIEWKGNFGIWTLLAGSIYFVASVKQAVRISCAGWLLIAIVVVHLLWLISVHSSERFDKKLWNEYRAEALGILGFSDRETSAFHKFTQTKFMEFVREIAWLLVETGLTGMLSWILFSILQRP